MKTLNGIYVLGIVLIGFTSVYADTITWANGAGGHFQDPQNWSPNVVPGLEDTAVFNWTNNAYTVTWTDNITNHTQIVDAGTVTFDLNGYTYSLSRYSSNTLGTAGNTTLATYTNGTVRRLDAGYTGSFKNERYDLRGSGSTLYVRNAIFEKVHYYFWMEPETSIILDGPSTKLTPIGRAQWVTGSIIVTNGAVLDAYASLALQVAPAFLHFTGSGYRGILAWSGMHEDSTILMDRGAEVRFGHFAATNKAASLGGTITLDDARWYEFYSDLIRGWRSLDGEKTLLQGTGSVEMQRIIMNGGTIRPGCADKIGVLTFTGIITNEVPTSVLDFELAGPATNEYDRIVLVDKDGRGPGTLYAGGILKLTAINDFNPLKATTFKLIDAEGGIVPAFDSFDLPADWRGTWDMNALYTDGELTFVPHPLGTVIITR